MMKTIAFLSFTLNLDLRWAGIPSDPFGSLMITNIGTLGLDVAYVPLVPFSHVPILLAVSAVTEKPIVVDGEVVVAKMMTMSATFDHRVIDGFHAATLAKVVREWVEHPFEHFEPIEGGERSPKA